MARILVADDEPQLREVVMHSLQTRGHSVTSACDGLEALAVLSDGAIDLLIVDVLMPGLDGLSVCRRLRDDGCTLPIIFLSSRDDEIDRVMGLELGGDDYVTKPFSLRELNARVTARLRSTPGRQLAIITVGPLSLDPEAHSCRVGHRTVELTAAEFGLLATLARRPGKVFGRFELVRRAFGDDHHIADRTVDSHIRRLRRKLGESASLLKTVHGVGYRLESESL